MACEFCKGITKVKNAYMEMKIEKGSIKGTKVLKAKFDKCPPFADCCSRDLNIENITLINYCMFCGEKLNKNI